jgi:hypothetical protein
MWQARQSPIASLADEIRVSSEPSMIDRWNYFTSPRAASGEFACAPIAWPVFASRAHAQSVRATLEYNGTDRAPVIRYNLPPDLRLAFVSRTVVPNEKLPAPSGAGNQLRELFRQAYPSTQR